MMQKGRCRMKTRRLAVLGTVAGAVALWMAPAAGQTTAFKTPWGTPDIQGIWDNVEVTPFERDAKYGTREFLTDQERKDLAVARAKQVEQNKGRDRRDASAERDVAGAYNAIWQGVPITEVGRRTSIVVDPPDGRVPPHTAEAAKRVKDNRDFQLALLQATDTCKRKLQACRDGKYDPIPSARLKEKPPVYNLDRVNRSDDPEDNSAAVRCLGNQLPVLNGVQR